MAWLISLIFITVIALELPYLVKNKLWKEMAAFSGLLATGMVYSFGIVLEWDLPHLLDLIETVFTPVSQFIEQMLS